MHVTLLTDNVVHAPDNAILEPDPPPPRDRHRENPTLREYIVRKPRIPQHLWTLKAALAVNMKVIVVSHPSNNYANISHSNLASPGKQPTPPTLSITTQDKTSFEPKPRIPK